MNSAETIFDATSSRIASPAPAHGLPLDLPETNPQPHLIEPLVSLDQVLRQRPIRVAYLSSVLPAPGETFVYREIRELRHRGWLVTAVSLNELPKWPLELEDLQHDRMVVHGRSWKTNLHAFGSELLDDFATTTATLWTAICDFFLPGEDMKLRARLRLLPQAVAGIGLARQLRVAGISLIHCHFADEPTTVGMYAAMQLKVPFSFTGHGGDLFSRRALLKRKLERAAFAACISTWHREYYRRILPGNDAVFPIIRCGVDSSEWTEQNPPATDAEIRILTVGRLVGKRGVDLLINGLAAWKPASGAPAWKLIVAGDGPERVNLERLALALGVANRVEFLGRVDNRGVRELMKSATLFALGCRTDSSGDRDGIPVALMEAMACGVPVICGDLPAIRELVVPGVSGLLVNSIDRAEWAKAFDQLVGDSQLRNSLAVHARKQVQQEFNLQSNVTRLQNVFEQAVRQKRGIQVTQMPNASETNGSSETPPSRRYALVTPCRDEARYAWRTLESVVSQTILPAVWVIVDDGSKDRTPKILAEYAAKYPFIKVITRADRGDRKLGGGVIDAFYTGYDTLNPDDYEYVCKLDLDLDLPPRYFETLIERMEKNPRLGTASGKPFFSRDGKVISEMCGDENSVGMVKFYRTTCFKQIGGFVRELMWDGIDCHRCRQLGWIAVSWDEPSIQFEHLRPMGTSHKSWWTGRVRHGVGQYFMGTGFTYMLASAAFRLTHPPVVLGAMAMLWGYLKSAILGKPRYGDPEFRRFLRSYQWACLLRGKRRATSSLNDRQARVWTPPAKITVQ